MNNLKKVASHFDSDEFYDFIDRVSDKIMENGSLTEKIGNETQFSVSAAVESEELIITTNLMPEGDLSLSADDIDEIGDFVMDQILSRGLSDFLKQHGINPSETTILANVLINGERPAVE